jgi:hypothetical protein
MILIVALNVGILYHGRPDESDQAEGFFQFYFKMMP